MPGMMVCCVTETTRQYVRTLYEAVQVWNAVNQDRNVVDPRRKRRGSVVDTALVQMVVLFGFVDLLGAPCWFRRAVGSVELDDLIRSQLRWSSFAS